jgi:hypothetical protein
MFAHAKQSNQTLPYRCLRNKNSVLINTTKATGSATTNGGLRWPIRSTMKADTANPPRNAIAAMIRVETVAKRIMKLPSLSDAQTPDALTHAQNQSNSQGIFESAVANY